MAAEPARRRTSATPERLRPRRRAERYGRSAEAMAAWWLRLKGYHILARRFRSPAGEIDIVARRGSLVAFVEVKARGDDGAALFAMTPHQRRRIERAAELYLAAAPGLAQASLRFDLMAVSPWRPPVHVTDAWRPGE